MARMAFANSSFKGWEKMEGVLEAGSVVTEVSRHRSICPASQSNKSNNAAELCREYEIL